MKLSEKIAAIESGEYAVTWTTPDGSIMKAADYGPYYVVYRNGEPMGAIDSRSQRPAGVNQTRKEVKSVNKEFFKLPKAVKRAVWAALLSEWQKKKPADR